jgi:hypothetical protein
VRLVGSRSNAGDSRKSPVYHALGRRLHATASFWAVVRIRSSALRSCCRPSAIPIAERHAGQDDELLEPDGDLRTGIILGHNRTWSATPPAPAHFASGAVRVETVDGRQHALVHGSYSKWVLCVGYFPRGRVGRSLAKR